MSLNYMIYKLRTDSKMSQERFAELFGVSRQSVQKWENGSAIPELPKLIDISKHFDISLDALILERDKRIVETMNYGKTVKPHYANSLIWEFYASDAMTEYNQSVDEGVDIERYKSLFEFVSTLPNNEIKKDLGDVLFKIVSGAKQKDDYKYIEPSDLEGIKSNTSPRKGRQKHS